MPDNLFTRLNILSPTSHIRRLTPYSSYMISKIWYLTVDVWAQELRRAEVKP
jgi:hypothetical protein